MQHRESAATAETPPCGKICSYDWDYTENGKFWPLLYKALNCRNTLYRMTNSPYPVIIPPMRHSPENLAEFTLYGQCPIRRYRYFDESKGGTHAHFSAKYFKGLLAQDHVHNINTYRDGMLLKTVLKKYIGIIQGKRAAVIGTKRPWLEAMLVNLGVMHITTIEYAKLTIDDDHITTATPYMIAEQFNSGLAVPFDTVVSYSSVEHSGLGRYGDPLTPYGDLEATAQIWCMVKPGGHFILAVPESRNRSMCGISWNAGRWYGTVRLQHLTANWLVLDVFGTISTDPHGIYILQKIDTTPVS